MQEVDVPLTEEPALTDLLGREVYRRTDYLVLRHDGETALVAVRKASTSRCSPRGRGAGAGRARRGLDPRARRPTSATPPRWPGRRACGHDGHAWCCGPLRARQLHLGAGADPGPGHRGRAARAAKLLAQAEQVGGLRRGPAARRAGPRRRGRPRPGRGAPRAGLPAAVPGLGAGPRRRGRVPRHPGRRSAATGC